MWNSALREKSISIFQQLLSSIEKIAISEEDRALGYEKTQHILTMIVWKVSFGFLCLY